MNIFQLVWQILTLQGDAYSFVLTAENGRLLAFIIFAVAGFSYTLGQSGVLFANRVPRNRFLGSLLGGVLILVAELFLWALSIWGFAGLVLGEIRPYIDILLLVAISFAPFLFGFFIILPVLGIWISKLLRIWVFLCVFVGVGSILQFGFWQALGCTIVGWLIFELLANLPVFDEHHLRGWIWHEATGKVARFSSEELADALAEQLRQNTADD